PPREGRGAGGAAGGPGRARRAKHRRTPACTTCHATIDPLGFALENFDAVGRWREVDESYNPIDASGVLPSGARFDSLSAFQAELLRRPEQFAATVTEKLLTYALGRGLEPYDMPAVRRIVADTAPGQYKLSALIVGITKSVPFMMRTTEPGSKDVRNP